MKKKPVRRSSNRPKSIPIPKAKTDKATPIPKVRRAVGPLNRRSVASGDAKVTKKDGKRLTIESADQKTEWLFVPKRGSKVTKNLKKT